MKAPFRKRIVRVILIAIAGFSLLFLFRFVYGYTTGASEAQEEYFSDFFEELGSVKRNYASDKFKYETAPQSTSNGNPAAQVAVDQKYEKTATLKSKTQKFDEEEKKIRLRIKEENAIIQYEHNAGKKGNRELHLLIGIPPQKFDTFYVELLKIGTIASKEITKIDKTNEFNTLNAKKASLEITRQSLLEIKKQSGKIDEYINLQNRILEIEQELQNLGVSLGDFDEENEFCTFRFTLLETRAIKPITLLHRLKVAFEWAVQYYLLLLGILALAAVFGFFLLLIIDKVLPSIISRVNQQ
jgi:Domain of unknown function (DUF4349)